MVAFWIYSPRSDPQVPSEGYVQRPYMCYAVSRIVTMSSFGSEIRTVKVRFLGWSGDEIVLPWNETIELYRWPTD